MVRSTLLVASVIAAVLGCSRSDKPSDVVRQVRGEAEAIADKVGETESAYRAAQAAALRILNRDSIPFDYQFPAAPDDVEPQTDGRLRITFHFTALVLGSQLRQDIRATARPAGKEWIIELLEHRQGSQSWEEWDLEPKRERQGKGVRHRY